MNKDVIVRLLTNKLREIGHNLDANTCLGKKECWYNPLAKAGIALASTLGFDGNNWSIHADCHRCEIVNYIKLLEGGAVPSIALGLKGAPRLGYKMGTESLAAENLQIYLLED